MLEEYSVVFIEGTPVGKTVPVGKGVGTGVGSIVGKEHWCDDDCVK